MTDLNMESLDALEKECCRFRHKIFELKATLNDIRLTKEALEGADGQVKFYTGLPSFVTLIAIFNFVSAHIVESCTTRSLTNFQQFLMVLIKLRLNILYQDLAYRFGINQ